MKYKVRPYTDSDYEEVMRWSVIHKFGQLPKHHLPATGVIVDHEDDRAAVAFLYRTDSKIAILEWVMKNPDLHWEITSPALEMVLDSVISLAKGMGFTALFTTVKHERLMKRYDEMDFIKCDTELTSYVRRL